jgi:hypothetical protein
MRKLAVVMAVLIGVTLVGCGSNNNNNSSNINGNWTASLTNSNTSGQNFNFGTNIVVNNDGSLSFTSFTFTTNSSCFASGETESGTFGLQGNFNGNVNGTFGMTISSSQPSGNTLVLNGTVKGNTINGTWTLTGSGGCTGSGNFVMTHS